MPYKLDLQDIIVVYDDMDLPVGSVRFAQPEERAGTGYDFPGESLGSRDFARIRIGIGRPDHEAVDWVLGRFSPQEKPLIKRQLSGLLMRQNAGWPTA